MNVPDSMDLSCAEKFSDPFSYVVVRQPFTHDLSIRLLQWLETEDSWKFVETDFYEQYEFSFSDVSLPEKFSFFRASSYLSSLKSKFETLFSVSLREQIVIVAHKLVSGHRIRIHNDYIPVHETHRLPIQLNRGIVCGSPDDFHASLAGLMIGLSPRKSRKKRMVNINDGTAYPV